MGGGYSKKFIGTQGSIGEHKHYQTTIFDKLPVRTKSNDVGVGFAGSAVVAAITRMRQCFCCEEFTISIGTQNENCPICGWIDDDFQNKHPDSLNGKNPYTLFEARKQYHDSKN